MSGDVGELLQVRRERDELQGLLNKFERHMAEIQANVKVLTGERDKLSDMYEEVGTVISFIVMENSCVVTAAKWSGDKYFLIS